MCVFVCGYVLVCCWFLKSIGSSAVSAHVFVRQTPRDERDRLPAIRRERNVDTCSPLTLRCLCQGYENTCASICLLRHDMNHQSTCWKTCTTADALSRDVKANRSDGESHFFQFVYLKLSTNKQTIMYACIKRIVHPKWKNAENVLTLRPSKM